MWNEKNIKVDTKNAHYAKHIIAQMHIKNQLRPNFYPNVK